MTSAIADTTIEALAEQIGINNKLDKLGLILGYKFSALDIYKANNYNGGVVTYQGTKQMLKDWRNKTPQEQQRPQLKKALEDAELVAVAEKHLGGQQPSTRPQPGVTREITNTINASESSNVSENTMIGQQTNVYNKSTPSAPVVHHHYTTYVKQAAPARPIVLQPSAQKRRATPSPAPPPKRPKVTQARPSTSKATTSKQKKNTTSQPKSTTQSVKTTPKKKTPTTPKASKKRQPATESTKKVSDKKKQAVKRKKTPKTNKPKSQTPKGSQKRAPKTANTKKNSQRKKQTLKKKKPPKTTKPKSQQRARSKSKPKKSKKK